MKCVLPLLALLVLLPATTRAELRIIGVKVTRDAEAKIHVTIASDVKEEQKMNISVDQAAEILKEAKGWGSSVVVGVVAHDVPVGDYLPVLQAISENFWLDLAFVEGQKPSFLNDNIKKSLMKVEPADPK